MAFVFFARKRKRQGANSNGNSTHYEQHKNNESELLEVDWDKIEDHYKEIQLPQQQQQQIPQERHSMADDLYSEPTTAGSRISSSRPPDILSSYPEQAGHTTVSPDITEVRSSNTAISPDVAVSPMVMRVVKPDATA